MSRQHPNIAVKRSPKNTWIIVEYVDTFYDKKHWSINGHFKDFHPPEETVTEILAACAAGLVEIFIKDISKHINDNPSAFIKSVETMLNNAAFLADED